MLLRWLLAVLALFAAPALAQAEERILNFHSEIAIQQDGSLDITETLHVLVENRQIRRGIFRGIPTRYDGENGRIIKVGFEFGYAQLNGQPVPVKVQYESNGVVLKIGDPDRMVPRGEHRYTINYRVKRGIAFFDSHDELYWNITPYDSPFPIDRASTFVSLPQVASFGDRAIFTGRFGSTASNARIVSENDGTIRIETTQPLRRSEGLAVALNIPKGIITPPSETEEQLRAIAAWLPLVAGFLGFLFVAGYYYYAWKKVGRDPKPGTVVPLFAPPDGMSPAEVRYLTKQRIDDRAFAAAMVEAGVKGHVRLVEEDGGLLSRGKTRIDRMANETPKSPLGGAEMAMLNRLLPANHSLKIEQEHHEKFRDARKALGRHFKHHVGKSFHRNGGWAAAGILVWILSIWLSSAGVVLAAEAAPPMQLLIALSCTTVGALFFFGAPETGAALRWPILILAIIFGAIGLIVGFTFVPTAMSISPVVVIVPALLGALVMISGFFWISAPTVSGRAKLDEIAGFKQYLSTTEGDRYDRLQAPTESLALFERFLPYAIALEVENRWADRFRDRLQAAAQMPGRKDDHFLWYSGSHSPWDSPKSFSKAIGTSFASSIASAATAPGSSSGTGGGGFSGGGGGGGSVGGW